MAEDDRRNHRLDLIRILAFDPRYRKKPVRCWPHKGGCPFSGRRSCTGGNAAGWLRIVESGD